MKLRSLISLLLAAAVLAGGAWWWFNKRATGDQPQLRTAKVERGTLTATVAASGTLAATVQVQVSSQVSGQIREVLADFNAEVKKGQVIARIDPETFEYRVRQAQADVDAAQAQVGVQQATLASRRADLSRATINLEEAKRDLDRKNELVERNFISPAERDKARSIYRALEQDVVTANAQIDLAKAQLRNAGSTVQQREALLSSARVDLGRTIIRAPVDGVVIKRSIEPGQTVAVSLAAPELFLIAQNLRDMQVEVSIDEAEVSRLRVGQKTTFTVDAFPGRTFSGLVTQVRKAALNVQNVITYTAVVSADNESLVLLPGMTANVRVITDVRESVLKVPNAALRFKPPGVSDPSKSASADGSGLASMTMQAALDLMLPRAQAQGQGGGIQAYRERLERELALTDPQKTSIDAIFLSMRERFAGVRDAPQEERAALGEKLRNDMRRRVNEVLDPAQRKIFASINADIDARRAAMQAGAGSSSSGAASRSASGAASGAAVATTTNAPAASSGASASSAPASAGAAATAASASAAAAAAKSATPSAPPSASPGGSAGQGGPGAQLRAFRERLERDLALTDSQRTQLDGIFTGMRERFLAVREAPESERAKLSESNRAEMRARINDILDDNQKKKYAEILVELSGRTVSRGRVFVPGPEGKPVAIELRLGLSDGATTEVIAILNGASLAEGDPVYVGIVGGASSPGPASPPRPSGPRL
jgi:HlyD family secretion protein